MSDYTIESLAYIGLLLFIIGWFLLLFWRIAEYDDSVIFKKRKPKTPRPKRS